MENSLPLPRELLHVRMLDLLDTRARMVHLPARDTCIDNYLVSHYISDNHGEECTTI